MVRRHVGAVGAVTLCALLLARAESYAPTGTIDLLPALVPPAVCAPAEAVGLTSIPATSAVLLIDMQQHFLDRGRFETEGSSGMSTRERARLDRAYDTHLTALVTAQQEVLTYANAHGLPVIVIEMGYAGDTLPQLAAIAKKNPYLVTYRKDMENAFLGTDLEHHLRSAGITNLFMMGGYARYCVRETARAASSMGFCVSTSEAVLTDYRDRWLDVHTRAGIMDWYRPLGTLVTF